VGGKDRLWAQWRGAALLRLVLFIVEGIHPKYGRIQMMNDALRAGTYGYLLALAKGSKYPVVHTTYLNVVAVAENMPGMVLQNKDPLKFVSEPLNEWPPKNNIYYL
jgi:hypothetical protein